MKHFHVHVAVNDLSKSITSYSAMFGEQPGIVKPDYAKWMLEDPQGIAWESFRSLGSIPLFGGAEAKPGAAEQPASCGSAEALAASSCAPAEAKAAVPARIASGCCART